VFKRLASIYSTAFRVGGLLVACLSGLVTILVGIDVLRDGYVLINGHPNSELWQKLKVVCIPLVGVGLGAALFLLVPRANARDSNPIE
jgi:hypothetical protein